MNKPMGIFTAAVILFAGSHVFGEWGTDYEQALEQARQENRYVLMDFTGSDWCGWCIKLDREVFSKQAFKDFAEENLVLVEVDFPRRRKPPQSVREQNDKLKKEFGIRGFPTIIMLNPDGRKIAQTGYKAGGPEAYVEHLAAFIRKDGGSLGEAASGGGAAVVDLSGPRTWTTKTGPVIEAEFMEFQDGWVHLKKSDGTTLKVSLLNLSEKDKKIIRGR